MKKKYFPNNWRAIKDTPDQFFIAMPYDQLEDWKIYGYELPDSVHSIVRTKDEETGKVKEFYYNTERGTKQRMKRAMKDNQEMYVCTMEGMFFLKPNQLPIDFKNDEPYNIL